MNFPLLSSTFFHNRRLAFALVLAMCGMATAAVLGEKAVQELVANQQEEAQARTTVLGLQNLLALTLNAETGQRGYVITGSQHYLAPYEDATRRMPEIMRGLRDSLKDKREQLARLLAFEKIQQQKFAELAETINLRREAGFPAAQEVVLNDRGRAYMVQMRGLLDEMIRTENGRLQLRISASQAASRRATRTILFACLLSAALLLGVVVSAAARQRTLERTARELEGARQMLERRVAERTEELAEVNADLREANSQLEAFSYTVAHDLRAPLRGIRGFADAVVEDYAPRLDETGRDYLSRIERAAGRMERLIEDLLGFARLARVELPLTRVGLSEVVAEALRLLADTVESTNARVDIIQPLDTVRANPAAAVQIVQNLLANALKFTAPGLAPRVSLQSERRGARVRLWVDDEGIGIPLEQRGKIFRPFERLHSQEEYAGTGIGLAIVDKAARRMGGACGVEGKPEAGSRFWVELQAVPGLEGGA